ncbi:MAG: Rpn family recombination-promoting nuclease/putative transposase [Spirochaeta sp.]|jgi:hypothetical protein|nr:Rpn family recombination-promoting nuclease/putative transposase [Spirochaeta sp.]
MKEKASNRTGDGKRQRRGATKPASTRPRSPSKSAHSHDRLFKEVFSTVEAQQDLVRMALPEELTSRFRIDTVRDAGQETGSGRMDLLLTVETIDETTEYVYVLLEHKSYRDATVAVQLLGYVAGIMRKHGTLPMPIIHPVVFYHGAETWTAPTELTGLHRSAEPAESDGPPKEAGRDDANSSRREPPGGYPVNLRYYLFDLEEMPPEQIAERARARASAGMIAMKYIKRELDTGDIQIIARVVARSPLPGDLWHTIKTYVLDHVESRYRQPLMTAIEENVYTEEEGTRMRSIADAIREEGMMTGLERGMSQGLEQGKADVLVRLLRRRFGLTEEEEAVVRKCHDAERLDEAADAFADPEAGKDEILALLR